MELEKCNFRRGADDKIIDKNTCYKKFEGVVAGISYYGKCNGEYNCIDFLIYNTLFSIKGSIDNIQRNTSTTSFLMGGRDTDD